METCDTEEPDEGNLHVRFCGGIGRAIADSTRTLGSTRALTDEDGDATDTYIYDAWGNQVTRTGTTANPFRWVGDVGYYWDDETGTFYIRARVYEPVTGRWMSQDPLGLIDGLNLYSASFVPNGMDPSGMWRRISRDVYESDVCHESLMDLAELVTGDARDWVCIWPTSGWWDDYPYASIGARANVSNLLGIIGRELKIVPRTSRNDGYLNGVRLLLRNDRRGGSLSTWNSGIHAARIVRARSAQGKFPIRWMTVGAHSGGGVDLGNRFGTKLFRAQHIFEVADEKDNSTNTLEHARRRIGPPRCWFTRDADIYGLGCHTDVWARDWAARILRTPATAHGTVHFLFANVRPNAVWFSSTYPTSTRVSATANTLADAFRLNPGWMEVGGTQ